MIFTIGYRRNYDPHVGHPHFKKMGKSESYKGGSYAGGSVWQTKSEAEAYLVANEPRLHAYGVYGVEADWETQTEQIEGEPYRRLLVDSPIVEA